MTEAEYISRKLPKVKNANKQFENSTIIDFVIFDSRIGGCEMPIYFHSENNGLLKSADKMNWILDSQNIFN